ncbi:hypothetical protein Nepgr_024419 [Nepenthes gracilis]|uniref:Pentatricopeptide repeat-containing protein At2g22410, mitochondrial-like n=1 Tax=Nepenthes gracilis TaxID=150966 RepID=A0AAD3Y0H0_NEPGR|nr:hypothetical protein Nepgr_024419 [Nepenthes gracilis]
MLLCLPASLPKACFCCWHRKFWSLSPRRLFAHPHHPRNPLFSGPTKTQYLFHSLKGLTTISSPVIRKWNSDASIIITNPTLLLLEKCSTMSQLKQIQAHMTRIGLFFHIFPVSRIIYICALSDFSDINYAHLIFEHIAQPNVYIWNTMIRGYCTAQNPLMSLHFFRRMVRESVGMDSGSFVFALKACGKFLDIQEGCLVHCQIWKLGFDSDLLVQNGLIHFYAENGSLGNARKVFDGCSWRDVVTWTAMIDAYVQQNIPDEALRLFDSMVCSDVAPNEITMIAVLSACSRKRDLCLGKSLCEYMEKKNICCSLNLMNAMLDMYIKCGCLVTARQLFDGMEVKDVFSWTSMINCYAKYGDLDLARKFFNETPMKNVVSWNAMIAGYSQNNRPIEAIELFHDMVEAGLVPTEATLVSVLSSCAQSGCLDLGRWMHHYYIYQKRVKFSLVLTNAFIDMYAKCGSIDMAEKLFDEMPERDLVSWNSMIVGFADHGHANKALILFEKMKDLGIKPDEITFIGVLSACSHGGLVSKGRGYFLHMESIFGLEPKVEHYACMIDLFGRVGMLEVAYHFMESMPMEPDEASWGALLNACRMHGNANLGKLAADKLIDLDPEDSGIYVLLANLCATNKKWGDVRTVRIMMRQRGIKKTPGHSSIEVEGKCHEFLVADKSHPQSKYIYKMLDEIFLVSKMVEHSQNNCYENEDTFFSNF